MSTTSTTPGPVDLEQLADRARPGIVRIGRAGGRGNGLVLAPGLVLTAAHNLRDRTTSVTFADGHTVQGAVTAADPEGDLVVVSVDTGDAPAAEWADPPALGATVVGVATLPDGAVRAVTGAVTATGRRYRGPQGRIVAGALEHRATLGRGTSGGPVLDTEGRVVGVNIRREKDGFTLARAATPELRDLIATLARGESIVPLRLGISVAAPEAARRLRDAVGLPPVEGVFVAGVAVGSAAERADVRRGDVLVAAGGTTVTTPADLHAVLGGLDAGDELALRVVRATDEVELTVTFDAPGTADDADESDAATE